MLRAVLAIVLLALACAVAPLPASAAAVPAGPRLATVALSGLKKRVGDEDRDPSTLALKTLDPSGKQAETLLSGPLEDKAVAPMPFYAPSWSADGISIAFAASKGDRRQIYVVAADGSGLRAVPGTREGADPVLSPDGRTLAFSRSRFRAHIEPKHPERTRFYSSATTWLVALGGGEPRRLTPWRNGLSNVPDSFSPDGNILALTKEDERLDGPRVVLTHPNGSGSRDFVRLATEAAFSPDGSQLAFISYADGDVVHAEENHDHAAGELYTVRTDGSELRRLTRTKGVEESSPSWDPSGQRIAFVSARGSTGFLPELDQLFPLGNAIRAVNADGTCPVEVASAPRIALYGVAWQPGVGREAARLTC